MSRYDVDRDWEPSSSPKQDGGPAFPMDSVNDGMSLRDYIALRASEADITEHRQVTKQERFSHPQYDCSREVAKYRYADAMLKAREQ